MFQLSNSLAPSLCFTIDISFQSDLCFDTEKGKKGRGAGKKEDGF